MKALLIILAITIVVQAQKAHERYDKFTDSTEASSGRLTVWKCGFLASPCDMSLESFVIKKGGIIIESGLRLSVFNQTGWSPNDSVLYVLIDGQRRIQYSVGPYKSEDAVGWIRTTLTYDIQPDDLKSLLSARQVEMKIDTTTFKLKDKLKDLQKVLPYLASSGTNLVTIEPSYGVTLAGFNQLKAGMTYAEVVRNLGEPGTEMARSDVPGYSTVSYQWKAKQGVGNMIVMFQNNKLVSKAQAMLK